MKMSRDISGKDLIKKLQLFEYQITRQVGSHIRVSTNKNGIHHLTIPNHNPLRIGTLSSIINEISKHLDINKELLIKLLFDK